MITLCCLGLPGIMYFSASFDIYLWCISLSGDSLAYAIASFFCGFPHVMVRVPLQKHESHLRESHLYACAGL